jgi:MFS transporter, CP family, cyanate transporter
LIAARFPNRAALPMGIYATALSLGGTIAAALTGIVADHAAGGWRVGVRMWGEFGPVAIAGWWMVVRSDRNAGVAVP